MITKNIPVPGVSSYNDAFDKRNDETTSKRLRNREILMKIGSEMGDHGKTMSMEDYTSQARTLLGPAAFLNNTMPSSDVLQSMMTSNNSRAELAAEKKRREQATNDATEQKTMEADIKDRFAQGMEDVDVYGHVVERYGADRAKLVQKNLPRMKQYALHEVEKTGVEYGRTMLQEEADAYIDKYKLVLSDVEKDAIKKGAQFNQSGMEEKLLSTAGGYGGTSGWDGNAIEEKRISDLVNTAFPKMSEDGRKALVKRAMDNANAAQQNKRTADDATITKEARLQDAKGAGLTEERALMLDRQDEQDRAAVAKAFAAGQAGSLDGQRKQIEVYAKDKNLDKAHREEITAGLNGYVFQNMSEYIAAVKSGRKDAIAAVISKATPMAEFVDNTQRVSAAIGKKHQNLAGAYRDISDLGGSLGRAKSNGERLQRLRNSESDLSSKVKPSSGYSEPVYDPNGGLISGGEYNYSGSDDEHKMLGAIRGEITSLEGDFIKSAARAIKGMREVITQNGTVGGTAKEIQDQEWSVAMSRANALVAGMGLPREQASNYSALVASSILREAGSPTDIVPRKGLGDQLRDEYRTRTDNRLLPRDSGFMPPGSVQPGPRANPSYPPAGF